MQNFEVMKLFESFDHLYENLPDEGFTEAVALLLLSGYFERKIAVGYKFHHDTV